MQKQNQIRLKDLRVALSVVVDELERLHGDQVSIDQDYFWAISGGERTNVYQVPTECTIDQLSDLISGMAELVNNPGRVTRFDAIKLSEILRFAGDAPR